MSHRSCLAPLASHPTPRPLCPDLRPQQTLREPSGTPPKVIERLLTRPTRTRLVTGLPASTPIRLPSYPVFHTFPTPITQLRISCCRELSDEY
jgi:hypothetical protein